MVKNLCHDNWHLDTLDLDNLAPTKILWKYLLHYHDIRCSVPYNLVADSSKAKLPPIPHCTMGLSIALRISKIAKSEAQIHSILIEAICLSCLGQVQNCPKIQGNVFCEIFVKYVVHRDEKHEGSDYGSFYTCISVKHIHGTEDTVRE